MTKYIRSYAIYYLMTFICLIGAFSLVSERVYAGSYEEASVYLGSGDFKPAIEKFEEADKQGDLRATRALGILYLDGQVVVKDKTKGLIYFQKAIEQGDAQAMDVLGSLYLKIGHNILKMDVNRGVALLKRAYAKGYMGGAYNLGYYYNSIKDGFKALKWWRRAALMGSSQAMGNYAFSISGALSEYVKKLEPDRSVSSSEVSYRWALLAKKRGDAKGKDIVLLMDQNNDFSDSFISRVSQWVEAQDKSIPQ